MLKKGQITIFIILGLIIFSIFAMLLYIRSAAVENVLDTQVQLDSLSEQEISVAIDIMEEEVINSYIDGTQAIALGGGTIGATGANIPYGIDRSGLSLNRENNYPDAAQHDDRHRFGTARPSSFVANEREFANKVAEYIRNNLDDTFPVLYDRGFDVISSGKTVEVIANNNDVSIIVEGEWVLVKAGKRTTLDTISVVVPHDLQEFFEFMKNIQNADTTDRVDGKDPLLVDIGTLGVEPYEIDVDRTQPHYDLITITDRSFTLDNDFFVFNFLRQNRPPDASSIMRADGFVLQSSPTPLQFSCPALLDPDEDGVWYGMSFPDETINTALIANSLAGFCSFDYSYPSLDKGDVCNLNDFPNVKPGPTIHLIDGEGLRDSYTFQDNRVRCDPADICCTAAHANGGGCYTTAGTECGDDVCDCGLAGNIDVKLRCDNLGTCLPKDCSVCP